MTQDQAKQLVRETLQRSFEKERFVRLVRNLLNHLEGAPFIYSGNTMRHAYADVVKSLERIGKYEDPEGKKIDVLIVNLRSAHSLEHSRTMQRNFIAWYLNGSRGGQLKDAALVAFHADDSPDWRFSLVRMDYRLAKSEGKVKAITELTPARRFSFLVGQHEKTHTAQEQLLPILEEDTRDPLLSELEHAFSIETVTKEFFERYRDLFLRAKEALDAVARRDAAVKKEFADKDVDTTDFAKKLLGQIVFLYFLQKKGWFGVARAAKWGSGPKDFLRQLFEKKHGDYRNFFNDILEPLFYEALAKERDNDFYSRFNCKIPFLNGGLFDQIYGYDWVHTDILLPDRLFSNTERTKDGDIGTGILDVFDRHNFTVKEDEPLEKDVAVDPEMLGKVFENLLEIKDRKSKGTYYTPREIVHYMCQESLVNYLAAELEGMVSREDIETLIKYGETTVEHDRHVEEEGETPTYQHRLPEAIRKHAKVIDEKLADIRICDPAVGSGAFPVGMMNEVVRTRNALTNYIESRNDRSMYEFKRQAIQNSLYGVDIDPGAVEIAKLRLWLSLAVDEEDIREIRPLPNLDYKIMQGNSLLEEFEGIKLFDEKLVAALERTDTAQVEKLKERIGQLQREYIQLHASGKLTDAKKQELNLQLKQHQKLLNGLTVTPKKKSDGEASLFDRMSETRKKAGELRRLHQKFFETASGAKKNELRKRIENLEWEFIETSLREQKREDVLKKVEQLKRSNVRPFFLWKLHFAEIFQEKGGFDVVIANPPYARKENLEQKTIKELETQFFEDVNGQRKKWSDDLYAHFIFRGIDLAKPTGVLCYITNDSFIGLSSKKRVRKLLLEYDLKKLIRAPEETFDATIYTAIFLLQKGGSTAKEYESGYFDFPSFAYHALGSVPHNLASKLPGFRLAFFNPIMPLHSRLTSFHKLEEYLDALDTGIDSGNVRAKIFFGDKVRSGLERLIQGRQIARYGVFWDSHDAKYRYCDVHYVPKKTKGIGRKGKPSKHEEYWGFRGDIENHHKPERLLMRQSDDDLVVAYHSDKSLGRLYTDNTLFTILPKNKSVSLKYALALLNSKLLNALYHFLSQEEGKTLAQVKIGLVNELPFVVGDQGPLIKIADKILEITEQQGYLTNPINQAKVREYEKQIDQLVYKLYGLTPEEVRIIEKSNG